MAARGWRTPPRPTSSVLTGDDRTARVVIGSAIGAVAVLVLLMPATPLVAFVLIAAISLGVVAALVRRAEDRRTTGDSLERLTGKGYLVLADRRSPGLTGIIGHLVIGPGGVFVVETRNHPGRVRIRGDQLIVGSHSHDVATHLRAQVAAVSATFAPTLAGTRARVEPIVCMRQAELPLLHHAVAGIPLLRESQLAGRIGRASQVLDSATVARLGELADEAMPQVTRRRALAPVPEGADALVEPESSVAIAVPPEPIGCTPEPLSLSASMAFRSNGS